MAKRSSQQADSKEEREVTAIDKLVQANRDYYHSWLAIWSIGALDDSSDVATSSRSDVGETNAKIEEGPTYV